ncbi:MAG: pepsin/retropepsin-like aspartic protease family protein [Lentimicrobiaceae bacterium]|nr:pepsin/retropepsin-like aspartic protease family protein [Lentimicrobiaceae bacterium]
MIFRLKKYIYALIITCLIIFFSSFSRTVTIDESLPLIASFVKSPAQLHFNTISYDPSPSGNFLTLTIPMKHAGRLLLIEANIDGQTGNLVFDTGATDLVLNKTYFRDYMAISNENAGGITGAAGEVNRTIVGKVQISDLFYENVNASIANLAHIENRKGIKILGLLGLNMIKKFEMLIDLQKGKLRLTRLDKKGNSMVENQALHFDLVHKIKETNNIMLINANVSGKTLNFCLDTGAESNVLNSYAPKKVFNSVSIIRRSNLSGAGSQNSEVLLGVMKDFSIGNKKISGMQTIITNLSALSDVYGIQIDGMLGYDFFEKGVFCINLAKKEMGICFSKEKEAE